MFWPVKTIALVGFPFDDVHVAPINMTISLMLPTIDVFTVMFKSHHHILPKLKTNSVMFYEWFDPAADISIAFWQP